MQTTAATTYPTEPFIKFYHTYAKTLIDIKLGGVDRAVFDHVLAGTVGWHKDSMEYKLNVIAASIRIKSQNAHRSVKSLVKKNILIIESKTIKINPDVDQWGREPVQETVKKKSKQHRLLQHFIPFISKYRRTDSENVVFSSKIQKILSLLPDTYDLEKVGRVIRRSIRGYGYQAVKDAVEYCVSKMPDNFCGYLITVLKNNWWQDWKAKQIEQEIEQEKAAAALKETEAKARQEAKEREQIAQNRESLAVAINSLPAERLQALEQDFITSGSLNPFMMNRYRKGGIDAVRMLFYGFIESKMKSGEVIK